MGVKLFLQEGKGKGEGSICPDCLFSSSPAFPLLG